MKKSPFNYTARPAEFGMSYTEIQRRRGMGMSVAGSSGSISSTQRQAAMEERLQANNPEAPQNQSDAPSVVDTGGTNQSGDTSYNTGANYIEQQDMMSGLAGNRTIERRGEVSNRNVRRNTYGVGGGSFQVGEYQDEWSANDEGRQRHGLRSAYDKNYKDPFSTDAESNMDPRTLGAMEGMYGDLASRQNSVMGNVPGAFKGPGQEFNDDRQDQFNDVLFNPNAKSDRGMNEMYNNFYNTQGIV